jgi:16S rRNA (cytosine1402-N4)-methyltransferase
MVGIYRQEPEVSGTYHKPVLLSEILEGIKVRKGDWYLDATLGDGGHSLAILKDGGNVIGIDVDPDSIDLAEKRFKESGFGDDRFKLIKGNFRDLKVLLYELNELTSPNNSGQTELQTEKINITAVIFDLGVSSRELEDPARGFSFLHDGPLDMRMDSSLAVTAKDLINGLTKGELHELFTRLGEEKLARRFAEAVVFARQIEKIETTRQLASVFEKAAGGRKDKIHPATRVFQALRIAVNDELHAIEEALPQALDLVKERVLVISFHSLEDRIVKNTFRNWQDQGLGIAVTKKPIVPSDEETAQNPRSRSAKLRIFIKDN